PSPLLPETGDEPAPPPRDAQPSNKPDKPGGPVAVRIDFNGISQRILALNIPAGDYSNLLAGSAGSRYFTEPQAHSGPTVSHVAERACGGDSPIATLPAQGSGRCAVPGRHPLIHAIGRQEEAALPGARRRCTWRPVGDRSSRSTG